MANHKPRAIRQQRAVNRKHKRALKAAHRRNHGRFDTMTGEDKLCHEKRALKRQFDALLGQSQEVAYLTPQWANLLFSVSTTTWRSNQSKAIAQPQANQGILPVRSHRSKAA